MVQKREYRLMLISLILLLTLSHLSQSSANATYSKTWEQLDGSELEITISSVVTNLLVNTKYTYILNLEAKTFGSNLDGFYSIAIGLRFTYSHGIIKSDLKCEIGELPIIGSKVHILVPISIPSANEFSLKQGESIQGQLQYIIYYSEQPKDWDKSEMAPNQWPHESDVSLGWETISQGKITNPYFTFETIVTIGLVTTGLVGLGIFIYFIARRRYHSI
ncbi:MAG: hypothetical protein ACFFC6_05830 [Promethearchaeota archaeon]